MDPRLCLPGEGSFSEQLLRFQLQQLTDLHRNIIERAVQIAPEPLLVEVHDPALTILEWRISSGISLSFNIWSVNTFFSFSMKISEPLARTSVR